MFQLHTHLDIIVNNSYFTLCTVLSGQYTGDLCALENSSGH